MECVKFFGDGILRLCELGNKMAGSIQTVNSFTTSEWTFQGIPTSLSVKKTITEVKNTLSYTYTPTHAQDNVLN
jgi:hypothetical protein